MKEHLIMLVTIGSAFVAVPARYFDSVDVEDNTVSENLYNFPQSEGIYKFIAVITSKAGICTGTILTKSWILTAAHCFYANEKKIDHRDAKIIAGVINHDIPNELTKQESMSEEIQVHPRFWLNRTSKFDIALVKLKDQLEFNDYVASIQVAGDAWPQTNNQSDTCMSLGFGGYKSSGPVTADVKVWNVTAHHGEDACTCARRYQYKRLVCVKESQYPRICRGDDGGPLVCGNVVRAIAHMVWNRFACDNFQYPTDRCADNPQKGIAAYMFLCPYNDWMRSIVPEVPRTPKSCRASLVTCSLAAFVTPLLWLTMPYFS